MLSDLEFRVFGNITHVMKRLQNNTQKNKNIKDLPILF